MESHMEDLCLYQDESGEVWLSQKNQNNQKVIKHLFYNLSDRIKIYQALRRIHQKNLPTIIEIQGSGKEFWVIEEYIEGVPVSDLLAGGRSFTVREAYACALQICAALKALHEQGIVHRDVKPGNLIMKQSGKIVLIDFDAAKFYNQFQGKDVEYLGTEGYAAPEQYGFTQTDFRTDIYALGVTIKELLPEQGGYSLRRVLDKCTAIDPDRRYQTISSLQKALKFRNINKFAGIGIALASVTAILLWRDMFSKSDL